MHKVISFVVSKGPKYAQQFTKAETDLTEEMLARYDFHSRCRLILTYLFFSGAWKTLSFKPYNFKALGTQIPCGALHPCM